MIGGSAPTIAAAAVIVLAAGANSASTRTKVAVLRPPADDALLGQAVTRIEAELAAAGFDVLSIDSPPGSDVRDHLEGSSSPGQVPLATFAIFRSGRGAAVEIWLADRLTGKTLIRRIDVGPTTAASVLAIRAVELLRASLLEVAIEAPPRAPARPAVPPDVARFVGRPVAAEPAAGRSVLDGVALEAGLAVLHGLRGIGAALAPAARLSVGGGGRSAGRLSAIGPASGVELSAVAGTATVGQELAALELVVALSPPQHRAVVLGSIGGGVFHLRARGNASPPAASASGGAWAALAMAGLGLAARLGSHAALLADLHVVATAPAIAVRLDDFTSGPAGRPSLLATLGLVTSWDR